MQSKKYRKADFCVIGAGSGGLHFAAGAVQMGASVILVERGKMGGDYLNYGCIPSKALIAAARFGHEFDRSKEFGWSSKSTELNFSNVHDHIQNIIASKAPHDSADKFEKMGIKVINREGHFTDQKTFETARHTIQAKWYIIATGSRPYIPSIKGLQEIPYFTNESIFNLKELPKHLVIIGGGPNGIEMAQAYRRLGSTVTILEAKSFLPKDDPEMVAQLINILRSEGIELIDNVMIQNVNQDKKGIHIDYNRISQIYNRISASHVLIDAGRVPSIRELNLSAAGIEFNPKGIIVDEYLRTTNPRVYAIGDCLGEYQFTHVAAYHANQVLKNTIFKCRAKVESDSIPWVTYTDPELAHVGAQESKLIEEKVSYKVLSHSYQDNDRARINRLSQGHIKVLVTPKGNILGATILGTHAAELIFPWVMAMKSNLKVSAIADTIAAYPTLTEINKAVAGSFNKERLYSGKIKTFVRLLMRLS
jgi:pyruvate/2-oxoglutarate dehydrogenase complex dihydrolipoamide dehydrogenase (E3) component